MQDRGKMATIIFTPTMGHKPRRIRRFRASVMGAGARSQATYRDIEQTRGAVPTFFKLFPESGVAGA